MAISKGADVNYAGEYEITPLQQAARFHRSIDIIELLLEYEADPNATIDGNTIVRLYSASGDESLIDEYIRSRWCVTFSNNYIEEYNVLYKAKDIQLFPELATKFNGGLISFDDAFVFTNFITNNNFSKCSLVCKISIKANETVATSILVSRITKAANIDDGYYTFILELIAEENLY